jgi:hypothetical protein
MVFNAYGVKSNNEGISDKNASYGFAAQYPNDKIAAQIIWREIQENFDPSLGFVQRSNVRMLRLGGSFNPRPNDLLGIQQMFHDVFYTRFTRLDNGEVETWNLYATLIDWHFNSGDSLHSLFDVNLLTSVSLSRSRFPPVLFFPPESTASCPCESLSTRRRNAGCKGALASRSAAFGPGQPRRSKRA